MIIIHDKGSTSKFKIDDQTGFLTAKVNLARVGIQKYLASEIGLPGDGNRVVSIFRPPEEVFDEDSMKSFENLVVTDDHPSDFVTVDNVKELQKGQVSNLKKNDNVLQGLITITDKNQINKVNNGKIR